MRWHRLPRHGGQLVRARSVTDPTALASAPGQLHSCHRTRSCTAFLCINPRHPPPPSSLSHRKSQDTQFQPLTSGSMTWVKSSTWDQHGTHTKAACQMTVEWGNVYRQGRMPQTQGRQCILSASRPLAGVFETACITSMPIRDLSPSHPRSHSPTHSQIHHPPMDAANREQGNGDVDVPLGCSGGRTGLWGDAAEPPARLAIHAC